MQQTWMIIFAAASVSYLLRAAPFVLSRLMEPFSPQTVAIFDSMSYAIIGGLVAESLIDGNSIFIRIATIIAAFSIAAWTNKPATVFYTLFGLYFFVA
jgi:hypothetical protein